MKRYLIKHDRDTATHPGYHWNLFETDTNDPRAKPVFVGFASWQACISHALGLIELRQRTGLVS